MNLCRFCLKLSNEIVILGDFLLNSDLLRSLLGLS